MTMTLHDALSSLPIWRRRNLGWWLASHRERDCPGFGTRAGCRCECSDHGCSDPLPPVCVCGGNGYTDEVVYRGGRPRILIHPCAACHTPAEIAEMRRRTLARGFDAHLWERATLASLDGAAAAVIAAWLEGPSAPWLTLAGLPGVGKTHAAVAAARGLVERGWEARFATTTRLLDALRATFDGDASLPDVEDVYRLADVLVLDDLGAEAETQWAQARLLAVLDDRLTAERITIITTNMHPARAPEDSRLWSRVFGTRHARVVLLTGLDRRRR